jgi:hypothetical protein
MRGWVSAICVVAALFTTQANAQTTAKASCRYDRQAALALGRDAFDQDPNGGWRALSKIKGCEAMAADLIADYRAAHPGDPGPLYWHEGQLRAGIGDYERAVVLFDQAKSRDGPWNLYVDGSVAFLLRDRASLEAARRMLASNRSPRGSRRRRRRPSSGQASGSPGRRT